MPTLVDSLVVSLNLDASQFQQGSRAAQEATNRVSTAAVSAGKQIESAAKKASDSVARLAREFLALYATIAGASSLRDLIVTLTQSDTALGRFSKLVGQQPQEIAAFELAVERLGGTAEGVQASFQSFSDAIQNMRRGVIPPFMGALTQLRNDSGLQIKMTNNMVDNYKRLSDALVIVKKHHGEAFAANIAAQIAGGDQALLTMLMNPQGGAGIEAAMRRTRGLAATKEDVAAAEKLQDSWVSLEQTGLKFARTVLTQLTPALADFMKMISNWAESEQGQQFFNWISTTLKTFVNWLTHGINWSDVWTNIQTGFKMVEDTVNRIYKKIMTAIDAIIGLGRMFGAIPQAAGEAIKMGEGGSTKSADNPGLSAILKFFTGSGTVQAAPPAPPPSHADPNDPNVIYHKSAWTGGRFNGLIGDATIRTPLVPVPEAEALGPKANAPTGRDLLNSLDILNKSIRLLTQFLMRLYSTDTVGPEGTTTGRDPGGLPGGASTGSSRTGGPGPGPGGPGSTTLTGGPSGRATPAGLQAAKDFAEYFSKKYGVSLDAAQGPAAWMLGETAGTFSPTIKGPGGDLGIAQWVGKRKQGLLALGPPTLETEKQFMDWELTHNPRFIAMMARLRKLGTGPDAAAASLADWGLTYEGAGATPRGWKGELPLHMQWLRTIRGGAAAGPGSQAIGGPDSGAHGVYPGWVDPASRAKLSQVNAPLVRDLLEAARRTGIHFIVSAGMRSLKQAMDNQTSGAGVTNSQHRWGAAVDVNIPGGGYMSYKLLGDAFRQVEIESGRGGRWLGHLRGRWGRDIYHFDQGLGYGQTHKRDPYGAAKVSALLGRTRALALGTSAHRYANNTSTTIGNMHIYSRANDAGGIATELREALLRDGLIAPAQSGPA